MKEILRLEYVDYIYEDRYPALKNVCVTISEGERIAVLGGNGAGKSTFFLCCNGVLRPQSGKIFLRDQKIAYSKQDTMSLRQAVGLVFQEPDSQIIAGSVESEVSFGPMNLLLPRDEVERRVSRSLESMNLDGYQNRAPQYLSGGEKKRVCIADILAMMPDILLLDEPTASLDPENVTLLEQTLDRLSEAGITLAVSTHDVDFAYRFATRGIVFNNGEIIADGGIEKVFESDEILSKAGLRKPYLYAAAELLEKRFNVSVDVRKPRNVNEFDDYISEMET
jgi:cobalt/nickel transport system ATP-binding protein